MKKLVLIFAILLFSCPQEEVVETDLAIGQWLLTDFTVDGIQPEINQINEGVLILNADGTGSGFTPFEFEWYIEDGVFYQDDVVGAYRAFNIIELNEVNFVFDIQQNTENWRYIFTRQ